MKIEIEHAVTFIVDSIRGKLPATSKDKLLAMKQKLTYRLEERYHNHWYTDKPLKGSAFRCINVSIDDRVIDVALRTASAEIAMPESSLFAVFPKGLALWVDPGDVSGQMGKGPVFPIYKKIVENKENESENIVTTPTKQHRPMMRPRSTCPPFAATSTDKMIVTSPSTSQTTNVTPTKWTSSKVRLSGGGGGGGMSSPDFRSDFRQQQHETCGGSPYRSDSPNEHFPEYAKQKLSRTQLNYSPRKDSPNNYAATAADGYYSSPGEAMYSFNQYVSYYDNYSAAYHPNLRQRSGQLYFPC
jgi:protein Tob/BTG